MNRSLSIASSSWISAARYDDEKQTLELDFAGGGGGTAHNVPPEVALSLEHTPSPGKFWRRHMGRFRFEGG